MDDAKTIAETHAVGTYIIYNVQQNTENEVISIEKGIGQLEKEGNVYYINRLLPISRGTSPNSLLPATQIADFEATRDTFLTIGTSAPSNINELLFLPHSVVSSNNKGLQTTPISENCLVGRLEGDIEALDITELAELLKDVSPKHIKLAPSGRPENPTEGTIIYNEAYGAFEKYDSNGWGQF